MSSRSNSERCFLLFFFYLSGESQISFFDDFESECDQTRPQVPSANSNHALKHPLPSQMSQLDSIEIPGFFPKIKNFGPNSENRPPPRVQKSAWGPKNRLNQKSASIALFLCVWRVICEKWIFWKMFPEKALGIRNSPFSPFFAFSEMAHLCVKKFHGFKHREKFSKNLISLPDSCGHFETDLGQFGAFLSELEHFAHTLDFGDFGPILNLWPN